jgi:hypothetical protein
MAHQFGNVIAVIDHALAHDLRRVRGKHGHDQRRIQQRVHLVYANTLTA